jgi:hypothetical protein
MGVLNWEYNGFQWFVDTFTPDFKADQRDTSRYFMLYFIIMATRRACSLNR